jgi:hypothetical protein
MLKEDTSEKYTLSFAEFKDYVNGDYRIDWVNTMLGIEQNCKRCGQSLSDICDNLIDFAVPESLGLAP